MMNKVLRNISELL